MTDAVPSGAADVLAGLDTLLSERPERVSHDFSDATRRLTAFRERLIAERRRDGDADAAARARLGQVNAVLSILVGTHYPLGAPDWDQLAQARALFGRVAAA